MKGSGEVEGRTKRPGEGVQNTWMFSKASKVPGLEAGNWDLSMKLESVSLQGVWGRCSCYSLDLSIPASRGGWQISQNAK
jgi:hypothetical protein